MKKLPLIFAGILATSSAITLAQVTQTDRNTTGETMSDDNRGTTGNHRRFDPDNDANTPNRNPDRSTETDRDPGMGNDRNTGVERNIQTERERERREQEIRRGTGTPGTLNDSTRSGTETMPRPATGNPGTATPGSGTGTGTATGTGTGTRTTESATGGTWPRTDAEETRGEDWDNDREDWDKDREDDR